MKDMTEIGGDLVFENCPKIATDWGAGNCLSQIVSVAGSVRLTGVTTPMRGVTFNSPGWGISENSTGVPSA